MSSTDIAGAIDIVHLVSSVEHLFLRLVVHLQAVNTGGGSGQFVGAVSVFVRSSTKAALDLVPAFVFHVRVPIAFEATGHVQKISHAQAGPLEVNM